MTPWWCELKKHCISEETDIFLERNAWKSTARLIALSIMVLAMDPIDIHLPIVASRYLRIDVASINWSSYLAFRLHVVSVLSLFGSDDNWVG